MTDCARWKEHYEACALGALEGAERAEFDAHLAGACPVCTAKVSEARWLVAQLAQLAPEAEPPATLRARLMQRVAETPQLSAAEPDTSAQSEARFAIPAWVWAAAAAVVLFFGFTLWQAQQLQNELTAAREGFQRAHAEKARLEAQRQEMGKILGVIAAPATRQVTLQGSAAAPAVKVYWNDEQGVVLSAHKMPALAAGRTFQLWVVPKKGNPISAGVFQPDASGNLLQLTRGGKTIAVREAAALAITEEPAGGSAQPTTKPAWVGPITKP